MLTISENRPAEFEPAPAGAHAARCCRIVDLGTQTTTFQGEHKQQRKILVSWELPDELMADGRPYSIHKRYTNSLHEKAALRRDLEAWLGRPLTAAELLKFDLAALIGKPCLLNVVHDTNPRGTFANVGSLMPLPKNMTCPEPVNEPVIFDIDAPDLEVFASLSERLQAQIASAPEWHKATGKAPVSTRTAGADFADDIPF